MEVCRTVGYLRVFNIETEAVRKKKKRQGELFLSVFNPFPRTLLNICYYILLIRQSPHTSLRSCSCLYEVCGVKIVHCLYFEDSWAFRLDPPFVASAFAALKKMVFFLC